MWLLYVDREIEYFMHSQNANELVSEPCECMRNCNIQYALTLIRQNYTHKHTGSVHTESNVRVGASLSLNLVVLFVYLCVGRFFLFGCIIIRSMPLSHRSCHTHHYAMAKRSLRSKRFEWIAYSLTPIALDSLCSISAHRRSCSSWLFFLLLFFGVVFRVFFFSSCFLYSVCSVFAVLYTVVGIFQLVYRSLGNRRSSNDVSCCKFVVYSVVCCLLSRSFLR